MRDTDVPDCSSSIDLPLTGGFFGPLTPGLDIHHFLEKKNHQRLEWAFLSIGYACVITPQRRSDGGIFLQGCFKKARLLAPLCFHQRLIRCYSVAAREKSSHRSKKTTHHARCFWFSVETLDIEN